jgi:hypothetical protein
VNTPVKLGVFAVALAAVFGAGAGLGAAVGPEPSEDRPAAPGHDGPADGGDHGEGYALAPASATLAGGTQAFRFRITDPSGLVVTDYEVDHDKELHLVVVSSDLVSFEHVHPVRDATGWWTVDLHGLRPGTYRAYADFAVKGGPSLVLEHELSVTGTPAPRAMPDPSTVATVDELEVALETDGLAAGESTATLRVTRDGRPVGLEPYLGAGGHLVAIRASDLAYLHVHPTGGDATRGEVEFALAIPTAGRHRLFLDFKVDGVVHTAAYTVDVAPAPHDGGEAGEPSDEQGHGH